MREILKKTQSVCSICKGSVEAAYFIEDGRVFYEKNCFLHGKERTLVARRAEDYVQWVDTPTMNVPPMSPLTHGDPNDSQCPLHCGPCENHLQTPCCVVIDVTDRCNQHCPYCFASAGEEGGTEPSLGEMAAKFDFLLAQGEERTFNIQISGGEPTVREDLPDIINLAREKGFEYIQLNTNGKRLGQEKEYAKVLRDAGTSVVFLQFDGTTNEIYQTLRNESLLEGKLQAIKNCRSAGLPVALVPMVVHGVNDNNIGEMLQFLLDNIDVVRGIHFQPVSYFGRCPDEEKRVTMFDVIHSIVDQDSRFRLRDFAPITSGHPLCCFTGTFLKEGSNVVSLMSDAKKIEGVSCFESAGETVVPLDSMEVIRRDRDFVLNKWNPEKTACGCDGFMVPKKESSKACTCQPVPSEDNGETKSLSLDQMDFDEFLAHFRNHTFTLSGMAFQDMKNMDRDRLKRCRVQVLSPDNRLISFCAYNGLYRGENR